VSTLQDSLERMNTAEEKEIERCVKAKNRGAVPGGASSKQDIQASVEEQQVVEIERAFTVRWEW
jgi:hypothetical protein